MTRCQIKQFPKCFGRKFCVHRKWPIDVFIHWLAGCMPYYSIDTQTEYTKNIQKKNVVRGYHIHFWLLEPPSPLPLRPIEHDGPYSFLILLLPIDPLRWIVANEQWPSMVRLLVTCASPFFASLSLSLSLCFRMKNWCCHLSTCWLLPFFPPMCVVCPVFVLLSMEPDICSRRDRRCPRRIHSAFIHSCIKIHMSTEYINFVSTVESRRWGTAAAYRHGQIERGQVWERARETWHG